MTSRVKTKKNDKNPIQRQKGGKKKEVTNINSSNQTATNYPPFVKGLGSGARKKEEWDAEEERHLK